jgi:hypothetical protein
MGYSVKDTLSGRTPSSGRYSGKTFNTGYILVDDATDQEYVAILVQGNICVVDMDDYLNIVMHRTWSVGNHGYVCVKEHTLHSQIMQNVYTNGNTVDHINWVPFDNRRKNLRCVGMSEQNQNRPVRSDKKELPDDIAMALGIKEFPKYIQYCKSEDKFVFNDHPIIRQLDEMGIKINGSGTKSKECSILSKAIDTLLKYKTMITKYDELFPDRSAITKDLIQKRKQLAIEYDDIQQVFIRDGQEFVRYKIDHAALLSDEDQVNAIIGMLQSKMTTAVCAHIGGPKNLTISEVAIPEYNAVARVKGTSITVYDGKYKDAMKAVNWDSDDMRIHISPAIKKSFPILSSYTKKKILLAEFVYWVLDGKQIPDDMTVATVNYSKYDVRGANLVLISDTGRGQKPPASNIVDRNLVGDIGMEFYPRGVTVSMNSNSHIFLVKTSGTADKKFIFRDPSSAKDVFFEKVLPILMEADVNFESNNSYYQTICTQYRNILNKITS